MAHQAIPTLDRRGLRQFGLILGAILALVFGVLLPWKWSWTLFPNMYWIIVGALVSAWALVHPRSISGLYRGWMRVALVIGAVINTLILAVVFFLLITPMGVISRIRGSDPMRRKWDANATTYRVRSKPRPRDHMERTY